MFSKQGKMADEQPLLKTDEEPKLKLNIKSTKRKDSVEVPCDSTVRQVGLRKLVLTVTNTHTHLS